MTAEKIAEKIPSWIKQVLIPELNEIKGEIKSVNNRINALDSKMDTKITSLDEKIGSLRNETKTDIKRLEENVTVKIGILDERITSLRNETKSEFTGLHYRFDSLEKRIPVIEEMAALRLKIAELEKKLAVA
jgi:hypothetical protein